MVLKTIKLIYPEIYYNYRRHICTRILYRGGVKKMGKQCPFCGAEVQDDDTYCDECGTNFEELEYDY